MYLYDPFFPVYIYLSKRYARFKILSCLIRRSVSLIKVNEVLPERRFFTHFHIQLTGYWGKQGKPQYQHVVPIRIYTPHGDSQTFQSSAHFCTHMLTSGM